ncbi:arsenite efflux MFS transporter ArsK [Aliirhizobium smilacinae]|uniref:Arsenite efflux MFS transporter ArsK n=1 Tax=Aliirhizobium smilacinae TaxID=1395944 RepID=A0A5C4XP89_9HYPH|nr:arsenite efflux MFS transporter ArsK [Rhizobium smilacinae]TNM65233.1 arsenite efflux MFS transporter ArsK [Rhizobium smilacinae]
MSADRLPIGAVLGLGVTQIIGYGTLYYSFSILAPDMARDFGLSVEWMFGALSVALLIGGLVSPSLGQWIDQIGAGRVMTVGSLVSAMALVACALSPNRPSFVVSLIVVEVAANFVQYGAAFALLVQIAANVAQRSITYLTLIAGFASTIFWPFTTALHGWLSWQQVFLVFAAMNALVCMPIHLCLAISMRQPLIATVSSVAKAVAGSIPPERRRLGFALMVFGFSLQALVGSAVLVHMVPLLSALGLGAAAALVGTFFGPAQVGGRLVNMLLGRDMPPPMLALISAGLMTMSVVVLATSAPSMIGAMTFAVLFGCGNGLFSIVSGTLPLFLFGSDGYGRLQGKVMATRLIVSAIAPVAFALAMGSVGAEVSLMLIATCGGFGVVMFCTVISVGRR